MKLGILADIHGNLEALNVCLEAAGSVEKYICLGDIVGYGPNPNECVEMVRKLDCKVVAGNHDKAVTGELDIRWFNKDAVEAIKWTQSVLAESSMSYLKSLPEYIREVDFEIVHGSLRNPVEEYISSLYEGIATIKLMKTPLCFVGHLHIPIVFIKNKNVPPRGGAGPYDGWQLSDGDVIKTSEFEKVVINIGSVGQPRDMDPRASFGIYDTDAKTVEVRRINYNISAVQEKMRKANLPDFLAERLQYGR